MAEIAHKPCPFCDSSDAFSYNTETGAFYCFSCRASPSNKFCRCYDGKTTVDKNETNTPREEGLNLEPYIPAEGVRGISKKILESDGLFYMTKTDEGEIANFVYPNATKYRRLYLPKDDHRHFSASGKLDRLQGIENYPSGGKFVTITEGEWDRYSVMQMMGDFPVVNVPAANPSKEFWTNTKKDLSGFEKIILSVDNDKAGNELAEKFYKMFPARVYRVNHGKYKDANDFLQANDWAKYKQAWWNPQKVKPDSVLCTKEDFLNLYENTPDFEYFETGIPDLDEKMLGIHKAAFTLILAETGVGKSLAPKTPVLRYDGKVVRAIDVQVGDKLMGPDSNPRTVTNVNIQKGPMYRVKPVKGEPFECNADHILSLKHTSTGEVKNVVLTDYLEWTKTEKHKWKLWRTEVEFDKPVYIDPEMAYCIGAYLGDGREQGPEVCMGKKKQEVINHMLDTYLKPSRIKWDRGAFYIGFSTKDELWQEVKDYLNPRRIPNFLKCNDEIVRSKVLSGLLDTDGSKTSGGAEITQKSEKLADDICFVARSLGLAAYKKAKWVNGQEYFRVGISGDMTFLPTKRLKFTPRKQTKDVLRTGFNVEYIGEGDYRGIALDGDHLFLLGDFTVTHNTELFRYLEHVALSTTNYSIAVCHGEETQLRSLLGLVSYDLEDNLTRKDLHEQKGRVEDVKKSLERLADTGRFYQFSIKVDEGVDEIVEEVRFLASGMEVDYIFIEPIQDFVSAVNTTEKESLLTDLSNKLKRLAAELNVGIVAIAHANADGDAKYCKSLVQSAAYEIRMERDLEGERPNETRLYVGRKNRTGGGSGPAGVLIFDKETYMLKPKLDSTYNSEGYSYDDDIPF